MDLNGAVRSWNPAAERMFGWPADEVLGRCLPIVPDAERYDFDSLLRRVISGANLSGVERRRVRKDGTVIEIAIWTSSVRDATGELSSILAVCADLSERKQIEAQLRQSQKMEAVGRLAGGLAHDFNNLLTVIVGFSSLALSKLDSADPIYTSILEVCKAGEKAAVLTQQLLTFSRQQRSEPRVIRLDEVLSGIQTMLQRMVGAETRLLLELSPDAGCVEADAHQIEQAIINLAINARDAMPDGGTITIEVRNVDIDEVYTWRHATVPTGAYVMLAVSDTGVGIDPAIQDRLFEPFFTTKAPDKGTGLGLPTVYGIVKQNRGHIYFYSEPGNGTTFKILLPRVSNAPAMALPDAPQTSLAAGTEAVLLVEDDELIGQLAAEILSSSGYRVLLARTGAEAIVQAEQSGESIALTITDVVLPDVRGTQLAERILSLQPHTRVLYVSGYSEAGALGSAGQKDFLQKPYSPTTLLRKVREILDRPR